MDSKGVAETLHQQVAVALERGARVQEQSRALIKDHLALESAVHDTLEETGRRRRMFGNEQADARRRSRQG